MGKKERKEKHSVRTNDDDSRRKMEKKKSTDSRQWCKNRAYSFSSRVSNLIGLKSFRREQTFRERNIGFKNEFSPWTNPSCKAKRDNNKRA